MVDLSSLFVKGLSSNDLSFTLFRIVPSTGSIFTSLIKRSPSSFFIMSSAFLTSFFIFSSLSLSFAIVSLCRSLFSLSGSSSSNMSDVSFMHFRASLLLLISNSICNFLQEPILKESSPNILLSSVYKVTSTPVFVSMDVKDFSSL